jgi:hypothetical protein
MRISPKAQTLKLYCEARKGTEQPQRQGRKTAKEQKSLDAKAAKPQRNRKASTPGTRRIDGGPSVGRQYLSWPHQEREDSAKSGKWLRPRHAIQRHIHLRDLAMSWEPWLGSADATR